MKLFLIILISLFTLSLCSSDEICESWICQKSKNICYGHLCGFSKYVLNPDTFTYFFKEPIHDFKFQPDQYLNEVNDFNLSGKSYYFFFQKEMEQLSNFQERLHLHLETDYFTLDNSLKRAYDFFKSEDVQQEYKDLYYKRKSFINLEFESRSMYYNLLEDKIITDVDNLNTFLSQNPDDDLRGIFLYPADCDNVCIQNYNVLMAIWFKIIKRLYKIFKKEIYLLDCDMQQNALRKAFFLLITDYSFLIQEEMESYFDYLMNPGICFTH